MKRQVVRGRVDEGGKSRRSSVHFRYESEEPSPLPAHEDSPNSSVLTVKTNHFPSHPDSLSAFELPIFHALADSRRPIPETQHRSQQEQFWSFLEKFGREGDSGSNSPGYEEEATVEYRTSTDLRNESRFPAPADSRAYSKPPIRESNGEEDGMTPPNANSSRLPRPTYAVAATQTATPIRRVRVPKRVEEAQVRKISFCNNLTFKRFSLQPEGERRYPLRATREIGRLKYWENQRIDYARKGYWVQKDEK